jgi:hypothetical protein
MKTILGHKIPTFIRGIVYLCNFDGKSISVFREILCPIASDALWIYANAPNPSSQLVTGKTYEELCEHLEILHKNMKDEKWLEELANSI